MKYNYLDVDETFKLRDKGVRGRLILHGLVQLPKIVGTFRKREEMVWNSINPTIEDLYEVFKQQLLKETNLIEKDKE